jgi:tyrosyl-tRNA synthetase
MKLSEELVWRGFIAQNTLKDITEIDKKEIGFYLGVDPSSSSMTIGNLAAAMLVRHFIENGHKAFLLVGGATGLIGDPDGKADERLQKTHEEISKNKEGIRAQYDQIFRGQKYTIVDNYDWFKNLNYLEFLRIVGKNVPLSSMLAREFVQSRLGPEGTGISYAEFSYSLIQGYDFLHLYKNHNVTMQLCGSDQIGNVIAGIDLIRRIEGGEAHAFAMPLVINKNTGVKFGKSESGAVWLDPEKTSVYSFYQFWLNDDDENVIDHLKIYTMLGKEEIENIERLHKENPSSRIAQKTLADEVTALVHGKERSDGVRKVTNVLFGNEEFSALNDHELDMLSKEIPNVKLPNNLVDVLIEAGVAKSKGEGRRLLEANAVSISGIKVVENKVINEPCLIKTGKNKFVLAR